MGESSLTLLADIPVMAAVICVKHLLGAALLQDLLFAEKDKETTMYALPPHRIPRMMEEFMRYWGKAQKKENRETHRKVLAQGSPSW